MRWQRKSRSGDVIDARGGGMRPRGGMPGGLAGGAGGLGLIGVIVVVLIQVLGGGGSGSAFGVDNQFGGSPQAPEPTTGIPASQDPERDLKDFSAYVFSDAQDVWQAAFGQQGQPYDRAQVVFYRGGVSTGCGSASSAVGPFYCPADRRVYLDLSFFGDMQSRLGAGGDFAWAYVIAHEVGHHVQRELGTSDEVRRLQARNPGERNALSVRLELQADCYAGVWAHSVYRAGNLDEGDVSEAVGASEAVGDDRLQRSATGRVDPDSFTHGSSEQRARWFNIGRERGEPGDCDTFSPDDV
jgi:predicted metalloprotease